MLILQTHLTLLFLNHDRILLRCRWRLLTFQTIPRRSWSVDRGPLVRRSPWNGRRGARADQRALYCRVSRAAVNDVFMTGFFIHAFSYFSNMWFFFFRWAAVPPRQKWIPKHATNGQRSQPQLGRSTVVTEISPYLSPTCMLEVGPVGMGLNANFATRHSNVAWKMQQHQHFVAQVYAPKFICIVAVLVTWLVRIATFFIIGILEVAPMRLHITSEVSLMASRKLLKRLTNA